MALLQTPSVSDATGGHLTRGRERPGELLLPGQVLSLLPTPTSRDWKDGACADADVPDNALLGRVALNLLPTPRATDGTKGGPNQRDSPGDLMLPSAVQLLPTPRAQNGEERNQTIWPRDPSQPQNLENAPSATSWGVYEPAIRRWEAILGRPAPAPTEPGPRGGQRLSPRLTEWMMGWPDGWVTDVPGITRNDALRICGNGVVPQQSAEALRRLLSVECEAVA